MRELWEQIKGIYQRLTFKQRITIGAVSLFTVLILIFLVKWVTRPSYTVLFSNLDPKEAGLIVERLKDSGVPYRLKNGGTTILVPSKEVYETRLELASQGLPQTGGVGYEIFDKNNLGVTDFIQRINYRRALEGELARTICQLAEIQAARVHLVIPEPRLFAEDQKEATASVTLKLKPLTRLSKTQIQGIAYLVASSVEGLKPENVTIIDSHGNILSKDLRRDSLIGLTSDQLELQKRVENYLAEKAQSLLEGVIGRNNAIVRVAVELDFERAERTVEKYDPENTSIRSEERNLEVTNSTDGSPSKRENIITNYEINKTIEHVVEEVGNIKRLSVAALINGTYNTVINAQGQKERQYVPRSPEEMEKLTRIIQKAVGYDPARNDQIEVVNIPFDTSWLEEEQEAIKKMERKEFWTKVANKAVMGISILIALFVLRTMMKKVKATISAAGRGKPKALPERMPLEIEENIKIQQQVSNLSKENPSEAAKLLKAWLVEEGK